ncbi:Protein of unknown function [Arenibacter nanhaiticus]|uniref:DUF3124 domain-containing protein n=1 Tax=Arenibacter nanhaiticus TaxID=558155 RepID=A0A1M6L2Q7_9FLAO|nr:DUF3124 domain-containing protein [Arenibacter nanhaiticus]SHJ65446.1 Protein of unknown function [Arenibacter nanhaiticus]
MKKYLSIGYSLILGVISCNENKETTHIDPVNWDSKYISVPEKDSLIKGSSYLSVYSSIYDGTEKVLHHLTATTSIRNINPTDSIYILKAAYYNTEGAMLRTYFKKPIFLKPLETIEIVIDQDDKHGGPGANFIFDWAVKPKDHEPIFEAVMISTTGQQGISFTTQGIKL